MSDTSLNIITNDPNTISVTTDDRIITITESGDTTSVIIPQSEVSVVQIVSTGAGGSAVSASYAVTASYALYALYAANGGGGSGSSDTAISASYAATASYAIGYVKNTQTGSFVTNSQTGSFVTNSKTGSFITNSQTSSMLSPYVLSSLTGSMTMQNLMVTGTASIQYLNVIYETASVIYSSGSNQFGDATNDVQTLIGTVIVSGSQRITGSLNVSAGITGSLYGTASYAAYSPSILESRAAGTVLTTSTTALNFAGNGVSAVYNGAGSVTVTIPGGDATIGIDDILSKNQTLTANRSIYLSNKSFKIVSSNYDLANFQEVSGIANITFGDTNSTNNSTYLNINDSLRQITLNTTNGTRINGSLNVTGTITGSLYGTASFATTASYALNAAGAGFPFSGSAVISGSLYVSGSGITITGSLNARSITGSLEGTSSWAMYALNVINPAAASTTYTASFSNQSTWNITHNLNYRFVIVQAYDTNYNEIIPENINLTNQNTTTITFPTQESGYAIVSIGGGASGNAYTINNTGSAQLATTGSNTFTNTQNIQNGYLVLTRVSSSGEFADDTAAAAGGVPLGGLYRNGNLILIRIT